MKPGGTLVLGSELPAGMLKRTFSGKGGKKLKVIAGTTGESAENMERFAALWEKGEIRAVIDSTYPLERIAEAHARAESWRKVGSVVVTCA